MDILNSVFIIYHLAEEGTPLIRNIKSQYSKKLFGQNWSEFLCTALYNHRYELRNAIYFDVCGSEGHEFQSEAAAVSEGKW